MTNMTGNGTLGESVENGANILIVLIDSVIFILSFTGNSMVVYTVLKERKLQTTCNYLLLNLAVCDIIVVTLGTSIDIMLQFTKSKWILGIVLCRTLSPTMTTFYISGSLIMVVISLDRYKMFVHPLKARYQRKHVRYSVIAVHIISLLCVIPFSVFSTIADGYCYDVWPTLWYRKGYTVFLGVMQYALPLLIMGVAYTGVAISLLHNKTAFKRACDSQRSNKSKNASSRSVTSTSSFRPHAKDVNLDILEVQEGTELKPIDGAKSSGQLQVSNVMSKKREQGCTECAKRNSLAETKLECCETENIDDKAGNKLRRPSLSKRIWVQCHKKGEKNRSSATHLIIMNETSSRRQRWRMGTKDTSKGGDNNVHVSGKNVLARKGGVRRRSAEASTTSRASTKREKRNNHALKMILVVVVVFAIFMLPMQIMSLILDFGGKPTPERYKIYAWFVMCSYFGSCTLNPFIYGLVDRTFRTSFKKIGKKVARMCNCRPS